MARASISDRHQPIKLAKQQKKLFGLCLVAVVIFFSFLWQAFYVGWFSSGLKIWFFDVGQGDAIFIETAEGKQILVDMGTADNTVLAKLGQVMLPWDRTIDAVVVTHPHTDHEGGLPEVLKRYDVGIIYETGVLGFDDLQDLVKTLAEERGTKIVLVDEEEEVDKEEGASLRFLSPDTNLFNKKIDNLNNSSIVLLLTYGETSVLLTGDAAFDEESEILSDITEPIDVLKVAHHGSVTSTSQKFLEATSPQYAIISVGADNDYGHPAAATLERLITRGIKIFRTDLDGDILLTSFGGKPVIESRPLPF